MAQKTIQAKSLYCFVTWYYFSECSLINRQNTVEWPKSLFKQNLSPKCMSNINEWSTLEAWLIESMWFVRWVWRCLCSMITSHVKGCSISLLRNKIWHCIAQKGYVLVFEGIYFYNDFPEISSPDLKFSWLYLHICPTSWHLNYLH